MTNRRTFIGAVAGGILAASLPIHAQRTQKVYRIGWLRVGAIPLDKSFWDAMRGLGWVEGGNVQIEPRYAGRYDQLPALAADLVRLKVDLIMTFGTPAAYAARRATGTIPIVFTVAADPVENGLVSSLAEPGGNLTGVVIGIYEEKRLQILKEAVPGISRVAYPHVGSPEDRIADAAKALGIQVQAILTDPNVFDPFFAEARKGRADALLIIDVASYAPRLERIAAETLKYRLPAIGFRRTFADAGGLLFYGPTTFFEGTYLASQVDRILKGAKPADLPVQQPTKFELVINMRTAKALGITIPASLLTRADELIR